MTIDEFKKIRPEYKDIEGDQLWNAMEDYMLQQQRGEQILKSVMPIWRTHTLRWLYYRKIPNLIMGNSRTDWYKSNKRCKKCKKGVNMRFIIIDFRSVANDSYSPCPHCGKKYEEEPNTNISHNLYKTAKWISDTFWLILDKLHLVRSTCIGRYDMFGDESKYVRLWGFNMETGKTSKELKKRKWWEYILIEKR